MNQTERAALVGMLGIISGATVKLGMASLVFCLFSIGFILL